MFPLEDGWKFVPTEDWRVDAEAGWAVESGGGDTRQSQFSFFLHPFHAELSMCFFRFRRLGIHERLMARCSTKALHEPN
jgi:hypothetical protein